MFSCIYFKSILYLLEISCKKVIKKPLKAPICFAIIGINKETNIITKPTIQTRIKTSAKDLRTPFSCNLRKKGYKYLI